MFKIVKKYLYSNRYFNISNEDLKLQLVSHPDYPSIKAITDTLDYFKIENIAVNLPKESSNNLPKYFLALLDESEGYNLVYGIRKKNKFILHFDGEIKKTFTTEEFRKKWTETIVVVEENKENQNTQNWNLEISIIGIVSIIIITQFLAFNLNAFFLTLLSLVGLFLSFLIVKEGLGMYDKFTSKICNASNDTHGCSEVINSAKGKVFNVFSLNDLALTFFLSSVLIYSTIGFNYIFSLVLLLIGFPVVVYSVYEQAFAIKKWCVLCLCVTAIFLSEGIVILLWGGLTKFSTGYTLRGLFIFCFVYTVWSIIKPTVVEYREQLKIKYEFLKFKRNQNIFRILLKHNLLPFSEWDKQEHKISFGASHPILVIDAITNPMCGYCADAFRIYDKLLLKYGEDLKINLLFNVPKQQLENKAVQLSLLMINLYISNGGLKAWKCIKEWYDNRDIELYQGRYGIPSLSPVLGKILESHQGWCEINNINHTPATVIDGQLYPKQYKDSDLEFLIGDLILEKKYSQNNVIADKTFLQEGDIYPSVLK